MAVLVLQGKAEGYRFETVNGRLRAIDIDATDGNTGTHILTGVDIARFDDRDIALGPDTDIPTGQVKIADDVNTSAFMLGDGGYVLVTRTTVPGGLAFSAQQFDAAGVEVGDEVTFPSDTASVVLNEAGNVFVVGSEYDGGVLQRTFVQRYDQLGGAVAEEVDITGATSFYALAGGGFVTVRGDTNTFYLQQYDANFATVSDEATFELLPDEEGSVSSVTQLSGGGYVVGVKSLIVHNPGSESEYTEYFGRFQAFTADGTPLGPIGSGSSIAAFDSGGFVVTSVLQDPDEFGLAGDILMQRYNAAGAKVGAEFVVNITTSRPQQSPSVAVLSDGGFVVIWQSPATGGNNILARRFDANGVAIGGELRINTADGNVSLSSVVTPIVALDDGGYVVKWKGSGSSNGEIFTQRVDADGSLSTFEISGTTANDTLNAGFGTKLFGLGGNDTLNGDQMFGGDGNDTYIVDSTRDRAIEQSGSAGGVDTVRSSVNHALGSNVENLILTGTAYLSGTGNDIANVITGNVGSNTLTGNGGDDVLDAGAGNDTLSGGDGRDTLIGGTGVDKMSGGTGDDTYYVDNVTDQVTEVDNAANGGVDKVFSSVSFTLKSHVENLSLTGTGNIDGTGNGIDNVIVGNTGNNQLRGGAGNDTLTGAAGDDLLYGETGADRMTGGSGNDTYFVDNTSDVVIESSDPVNGGIDTVVSSISRTLGAYQENLNLIGGVAINGNGNSLNNTLTGNSGANTLRGFEGNDILDGGADTRTDTLDGGLGNDVFVLGNGNDTVIDAGGTDTIRSTISRTLMDYGFIERLTLQGTANINGTGNALANTITGNSGDNTLDGGGGQDALAGGLGNDRYILGASADTVTDTGGIDTIYSTITRSLTNYADIERLILQGGADINGTGNLLNNSLTGNTGDNTLNGAAGNDVLSGGSGDDVLIGGTGNDTLTGGSGKDIFLLNAPLSASTNVDFISDFSVADDTIRLENSVFTKIGAAGPLSSSAFVRNSTGLATTDSHRLIYETDTGELYYDSNGKAAGGSVLVATLDPNLALTHQDFFIV